MASVLQEADDIINNARQSQYGHPLDDFTRTAGMLKALFGWDVEARHIPLIMVCVKMSREANTPKRDNWVDGAGYFGTLELLHDEHARRYFPSSAGVSPDQLALDVHRFSGRNAFVNSVAGDGSRERPFRANYGENVLTMEDVGTLMLPGECFEDNTHVYRRIQSEPGDPRFIQVGSPS